MHTICRSTHPESKKMSVGLSVAENIGSQWAELITHCFMLLDLLTVNMANMALLISVWHNGNIDCTDL